MPEFEESEGFKLKSGNKTSFKQMGSSPTKHTTNREGHEDKYGKGHANSKHPKYWKVQERTVTRSDKNPDYDETFEDEDHANYDPDYSVDERMNKVDDKVYLSRKDMEIQTTKNTAAGKKYTGVNVWNELPGDVGYTSTNTVDKIGKTDGNTYNTKSYKSKSKTKSKSKSKSKSVYKTNVFGKVKKGKGRVKKALKNIKSKITFWNPND